MILSYRVIRWLISIAWGIFKTNRLFNQISCNNWDKVLNVGRIFESMEQHWRMMLSLQENGWLWFIETFTKTAWIEKLHFWSCKLWFIKFVNSSSDIIGKSDTPGLTSKWQSTKRVQLPEKNSCIPFPKIKLSYSNLIRNHASYSYEPNDQTSDCSENLRSSSASTLTHLQGKKFYAAWM